MPARGPTTGLPSGLWACAKWAFMKCCLSLGRLENMQLFNERWWIYKVCLRQNSKQRNKQTWWILLQGAVSKRHWAIPAIKWIPAMRFVGQGEVTAGGSGGRLCFLSFWFHCSDCLHRDCTVRMHHSDNEFKLPLFFCRTYLLFQFPTEFVCKLKQSYINEV